MIVAPTMPTTASSAPGPGKPGISAPAAMGPAGGRKIAQSTAYAIASSAVVAMANRSKRRAVVPPISSRARNVPTPAATAAPRERCSTSCRPRTTPVNSAISVAMMASA